MRARDRSGDDPKIGFKTHENKQLKMANEQTGGSAARKRNAAKPEGAIDPRQKGSRAGTVSSSTERKRRGWEKQITQKKIRTNTGSTPGGRSISKGDEHVSPTTGLCVTTVTIKEGGYRTGVLNEKTRVTTRSNKAQNLDVALTISKERCPGGKRTGNRRYSMDTWRRKQTAQDAACRHKGNHF